MYMRCAAPVLATAHEKDAPEGGEALAICRQPRQRAVLEARRVAQAELAQQVCAGAAFAQLAVAAENAAQRAPPVRIA